MSRILTHPAVPMPTTTAPNILTKGGKDKEQVWKHWDHVWF